MLQGQEFADRAEHNNNLQVLDFGLKDVTIRLHKPKDGKARLSIITEMGLRQRDGQVRRYGIIQAYQITPGQNDQGAVVHTIRKGMRLT